MSMWQEDGNVEMGLIEFEPYKIRIIQNICGMSTSSNVLAVSSFNCLNYCSFDFTIIVADLVAFFFFINLL